MGPIDFHRIFLPYYGTVWLYRLQNIFFCVQQKKEIHTELEQHEDE